MYLLRSVEGSKHTERDLGSVSVTDARLHGIEKAPISSHTICFYSHEDSISQEIWQGEAEAKKHWAKGSVGFMPAGSEITSMPVRPYRETVIKFTPDLFDKAIGSDVDISKVDYRFADVTDPTTSGLAGILQNLAANDAEQWPMLVESASMALAVAIVRQMSPSVDASLKPGNIPALCSDRETRVREYIEAHLYRHITLMEVADVAALSQYHFSRQFHRAVGMTPSRYIMCRRVEGAKLALQQPGATLSGVAFAFGFSGQSHFTTAFKSLTGVTPGEYRKSGGLPVHVGIEDKRLLLK